MIRKRMFLAVIAVAALLAGCTAGGATADGRGRSVYAEKAAEPMQPANVDARNTPAMSEQQHPAGGSSTTATLPASTTATTGTTSDALSNLPSQRMVIKTGELSVRVNDVPAAFARAIQLAEAGGGYVQSSTQGEEGGQRADLTIRVPPNGFLPLLASLGALGTVTSRTVSGEDVTEEYYDLTAELDNQVEVRGRLLQLLKQAVKVPDAVTVEEQLERVGANLNRIKGRMKYLETMSSLCTVNATFYGEERVAASDGLVNWSLVSHGFWRAAQLLVNVFFILLQVLVVAIPLAIVVGASAWGIVRLVRIIQRKRAQAGR
ncbi:MAG TPA: DUF4349 domain-containing protein [Spirochaetia bacterium]|nr:DUF4349 domain-containing protein [Spirochaetia bacterium]